VAVLLIAVRRLHPFRNCTASTRTVSHFCHNRRHIARFVIFSYHTLVIRIFRQLLSEPRKGLCEAGVWTLLLTSSYPAVNSLRYLRHHISTVFSPLVVKIFKQLLSELRKGLSEAEVWDLFGITRPSAPDDLHGRISHSVPMIVGPRSRYLLQHRYRPPGVPLSFMKKRSLTHAFFIPPRGECEGYRRPGSKQRFFFFIKRYEK
jgi:hypothetical protein